MYRRVKYVYAFTGNAERAKGYCHAALALNLLATFIGIVAILIIIHLVRHSVEDKKVTFMDNLALNISLDYDTVS